MSSSPDAKIVYGVDLGGADNYGTLAPVKKFYGPDVDWFRDWAELDSDERGEGPFNYLDIVAHTLAVRSGWDPAGVSVADHLRDVLRVEVVRYGSYEWDEVPGVLAAVGDDMQINTYAWHPQPLDVEDLNPVRLLALDPGRDIVHALALLGLTSTREPCWLLVADYG